jgi:hypothetical protein
MQAIPTPLVKHDRCEPTGCHLQTSVLVQLVVRGCFIPYATSFAPLSDMSASIWRAHDERVIRQHSQSPPGPIQRRILHTYIPNTEAYTAVTGGRILAPPGPPRMLGPLGMGGCSRQLLLWLLVALLATQWHVCHARGRSLQALQLPPTFQLPNILTTREQRDGCTTNVVGAGHFIS